MNTQFVDIAATVSNMVQNTVSLSDGGGAGVQTGNGKAFENRFQQEINRLESRQNSATGPIVAVTTQANARNVASRVSDTTETMQSTSGGEFLSKLKRALREISGGNLSDMVTDPEGLDALKKLLLRAGFNADEVDGILSDLKEESETGTLSLDKVFDALSELEVEVDEKADTEVAYLASSSLPYVKTLLSELGLSEEEITGIVEEADEGSDGLSLDVIIEKLKSLGETSLAVEDSDGSFKALMAKLNLPVQEGADGTVTINDLIKAFEDYRADQQRQDAAADASAALTADADSLDGLLNSFFQSISLASETESLSFSYQEVKDQFVNELMIPDGDDTEQKSLFAPQTAEEDTKTNTLAKQVAALLSGNGKAGSEPLEQDRTTMTTLGKEAKTELTKADAVVQVSTATGSDVETSTNASQAKATPRTLPAYVTNQVGRGIVRAMNQGESSLTLQLKPAELGRLTMTIDHQSTGIKVNIVTENHAARDILASNVNELKSALSTAGISLESFEVDMSSDFKQSMANTGNQFGQSGRRNGSREGAGGNGQGGEGGDEINASAAELATDGSYHFVA